MTSRREDFEDTSAEIPEAVVEWLGAGSDSGVPVTPSVREWLAQAPENQRALDDFERVWRLSQAPPPPNGWPALRSRIERAEARPRRDISPAARRGSILQFAIAAAAVMAIGAGVYWPRDEAASLAQAQPTVVTVPPGATSTVRLSDGVVVQINSASTLSYSAPRDGIQEVRLAGEAYFSVPHDPSRTFRVVTDVGVVKDIGTEFNVEARSGKVAVTVVDGVAELEAAGRQVSLRAGQMSFALKGAAPVEPGPANLTAALSWMHGRLVFLDEPLETVAAALNRRFGVPFDVSDDLKAVRLTASMTARESTDAAAAVCAAVSARCEPLGAGWSITRRPK